MKTLVISDLHEDVRWAQSILEKEKDNFDRFIYLGDFFDTRNPKPTAGVEDTCKFMADNKEKFGSRMVCLLGNHDMPLAYMLKTGEQSGRFYCSGFDYRKSFTLKRVLGVDFFNNWKLAHYEDGILYSHAGARSDFLKDGVEVFIKETDEVAKDFRNKQDHKFFDIARCRGGRDQWGGLTWRDKSEWLWDSGMWQVVGHTPVKSPEINKMVKCVFLDTKQKWYAVIKDGREITFKNPFDNEEIHDTLGE
jgi:hypothetical protein